MLAPLEGFVVGITADRRADEQADLFARRGARVVHGPMVRTRPLERDDVLRRATDDVIAHPPDIVLANTGIGIRGWLTAAASWGVEDQLTATLAASRVFARGAKAAGAVAAIGVDVAWRAPNESLRELLVRVLEEPLEGRTVAFQEHGAEAPELVDSLRHAGARVVEIPVYRLGAPDKTDRSSALVGQVCDGDVDALTFTSAPAVDAFFTVARGVGADDDVRAALRRRVVPAVVGPHCARAARAHGLDDLVEPVAARRGSMVRAVTDRLAASRRALDGEQLHVVVQGRAVHVTGAPAGPGRSVWLSTLDRWLLDRRVERPGALVSRAALGRAAWGAAVDDHALDVAIARLRRRLGVAGGLVQTVPKRGYRVAVEPT